MYLADDDDDDDDDDGDDSYDGHEARSGGEMAAKFSSARTRGLQPASAAVTHKPRALDNVLSSCLATQIQVMEHIRYGLEQLAGSRNVALIDVFVGASEIGRASWRERVWKYV